MYFYPKADTPGCTTQSCTLRDAEPDLKKLKAVVLGISPDTPEKQLKFDDKYGLGFPLLADTEHTVAEKYGVWGEKVNYGRKYMGIIRSAFVVDATGKLAAVVLQDQPQGHRAQGDESAGGAGLARRPRSRTKLGNRATSERLATAPTSSAEVLIWRAPGATRSDFLRLPSSRQRRTMDV